MRLCNQLNEGLWKTVDAYEGFCSKHASVFADFPRSAIDKIFDELKGRPLNLLQIAAINVPRRYASHSLAAAASGITAFRTLLICFIDTVSA